MQWAKSNNCTKYCRVSPAPRREHRLLTWLTRNSPPNRQGYRIWRSVDRPPIRTTKSTRTSAKPSGATLRCAPPALALRHHSIEGGQLFEADPGHGFDAV